MPVLPPPVYASSYGSLSGAANSAGGQTSYAVFPQYLGDRFGWDTMTATLANVSNSLPPAERSQACIFTLNYGEASALIFLGKKYDLPPVISGHNNFYLWGPGSCNGQVIITVGFSRSDDLKSFMNVTQVALITCSYCQPEENNLPVYLCTQPIASVQSLWANVKHFD